MHSMAFDEVFTAIGDLNHLAEGDGTAPSSIPLLVTIAVIVVLIWLWRSQRSPKDRNQSTHVDPAKPYQPEQPVQVSQPRPDGLSTERDGLVHLEKEIPYAPVLPSQPASVENSKGVIITRTGINATGRPLKDGYEPGTSTFSRSETHKILVMLNNHNSVKQIAFSMSRDLFEVGERFIQVVFGYWGSDLLDKTFATKDGKSYSPDELKSLQVEYAERQEIDVLARRYGRTILGIGIKIANTAAQGNISSELLTEWSS